MSLTLANFIVGIQTKIRADQSSPTANDVHDNSIKEWANELIHVVMEKQYNAFIKNGGMNEDLANIFSSLITYDSALTFSSGVATRPSDCFAAVNVIVTADSITSRRAELLDLKAFRRWDSRNFALTPTVELPKVCVADSIRVKPTSITAGKIDYVKNHPTITTSQAILVNEIGQEALRNLVMAEYFDFIGENSKANDKRSLADKVLNDSGKQIKV